MNVGKHSSYIQANRVSVADRDLLQNYFVKPSVSSKFNASASDGGTDSATVYGTGIVKVLLLSDTF